MTKKNIIKNRKHIVRKKRSKTTKGALIKGMSVKLPVSILDNEVFNQRLKDIMKGNPGIYVLYRKNQLYYAGLTTDLFWRIYSHRFRDRHAGKWDSFVIFRINRVKYLKDIETLITHLFEFPGARVKGAVPRDANITRILREILAKETKDMKSIARVLKRK